MHDFRELRKATREAIGKCDCTLRQRIQYRARLAACDSDRTLEMLSDELQQRGVLPVGYGEPVAIGAPAPQAPDWSALVAAIIEIINMLSDK